MTLVEHVSHRLFDENQTGTEPYNQVDAMRTLDQLGSSLHNGVIAPLLQHLALGITLKIGGQFPQVGGFFLFPPTCPAKVPQKKGNKPSNGALSLVSDSPSTLSGRMWMPLWREPDVRHPRRVFSHSSATHFERDPVDSIT